MVALEQLKHVADEYGNGVVDTANKVGAGSMSSRRPARPSVKAAQAKIADAGRTTSPPTSTPGAAARQQAAPLMAKADPVVAQLAALLDKADAEGVPRWPRASLPVIDPVAEVIEKLALVQLDGAGRRVPRRAEALRPRAVDDAGRQRRGAGAGGAGGPGLIRSITGPIAAPCRSPQTVAAGDLGSRIVVDGRDETGALLRRAARMNDSLVGIVGQVRDSSDSIATGSAQIATGNADLSQRTEEQASNLQQTAASMEQLSATVSTNADTARHASELAAGASAAAGAAATGGPGRLDDGGHHRVSRRRSPTSSA